MSKTFDLAQLEASEVATLEVIGLDGEPLQGDGGIVTIELYGPGSTEYQRSTSKLESAAQTRAFAALRGKTQADSADVARADLAAKLAACTRAIHHLPLSAADLYENPKLGYITNQVAKFIEDWGNFLPKQAKA